MNTARVDDQKGNAQLHLPCPKLIGGMILRPSDFDNRRNRCASSPDQKHIVGRPVFQTSSNWYLRGPGQAGVFVFEEKATVVPLERPARLPIHQG